MYFYTVLFGVMPARVFFCLWQCFSRFLLSVKGARLARPRRSKRFWARFIGLFAGKQRATLARRAPARRSSMTRWRAVLSAAFKTLKFNKNQL